VDRALQVLVEQLDEATNLASSVRRDAPPVIEAALVFLPELDRTELLKHRPGALPTLEDLPGKPRSITVEIIGANFRPGASAILIAQDHEELPELHTWNIQVNPPNEITATFRNPKTVPGGADVTWLVAVTNKDGTHSNQFPI